MLAVFLNTFRESIHRRIALALIVISLLVPIGYVYFMHFEAHPDGIWIGSGRAAMPARMYVQQVFAAHLQLTAQLWVILGLMAVAPLLTSPFEKGWVELVLAKGVARWQILAGRLAGALAVFAVTIFLMDAVPALYLLLRAHVPVKPYFLGLLLVLLGFLGTLALMALVAITQTNPAALIVIAFVQLTLSSVLAARAELYRVISWKWVHPVLEWMWRILPKNSDLSRLATAFLAKGAIESWLPIWTTALFVVCALGLSVWCLSRKSF